MNDFKLLRPFDLKAANRGEAICNIDGSRLTFVVEGGKDERHAARNQWNNLALLLPGHLRMAPLGWVEDKPVYKGDKLFDRKGEEWTAQSFIDNEFSMTDGGGWSCPIPPANLSWTKPEPVSTLTADDVRSILKAGRESAKGLPVLCPYHPEQAEYVIWNVGFSLQILDNYAHGTNWPR